MRAEAKAGMTASLRQGFLSTVVAGAGVFVIGTAGAAQVQTSFAGIVTANNPYVGMPAIGSTFSGTFTIDPAASVLTADAANCAATATCWAGVWAGATTSWSLNGEIVNALHSLPQMFGVRFALTDSAPGQGADIYTVYLGGMSITTVALTLTDSTGNAFEAAANPLFPSFGTFDSSNFSYHPLCVTGISCVGNPYYAGSVTSLASAPVPEPGTTAMMLAGLMATGALVRRRSRSQKHNQPT
jgi:hypothetical protein